MKVENWPVGRVKPYAANPRDNADAVAKVAASIAEFGWQQPLVVDSDGVLIVGHTRLLAAQELGLDEVPVVVAGALSAAKARAYRLADNRTHEEAKWIDEVLAGELLELERSGYDLGATGFEERELARLIGEGTRREAAGENEAPELPVEPVCQPGDLWTLGDHRLLCGDSTAGAAVARLLGDDRPGLMVTDPPYGVMYDASWRRGSGNGKAATIANDDVLDWRDAWRHFAGAVAYVWHGGLNVLEAAASLRASGFQLRAQIVWVKPRFVLSRGHYHWGHEPALYAARPEYVAEPSEETMLEEQAGAFYGARDAAHWSGTRAESTVWHIEADASVLRHPTQKPVECMLRPMLNNSRRGDAVYEPFCGSGSSIIAAEKAGRRCLAIELDPKFCDVAISRWETFTGGRASRE